MKEEKSTLKLMLEFNLVALLIPFIVIGGIYLYTYLAQDPLSKSQWKTVVFVVWSGTLLIFFKEAFRNFLVFRKKSGKLKKK